MFKYAMFPLLYGLLSVGTSISRFPINHCPFLLLSLEISYIFVSVDRRVGGEVLGEADDRPQVDRTAALGQVRHELLGESMGPSHDQRTATTRLHIRNVGKDAQSEQY